MPKLLQPGTQRRSSLISKPTSSSREADGSAFHGRLPTRTGFRASINHVQQTAGNRAIASALRSRGGVEDSSTNDRRKTTEPFEPPLKPLSRTNVTARHVPDRARAVLRRDGRILDPQLRTDMEARFGYDFRSVRVHDGSEAAASALELRASAYTLGQDIVFGSRQFQPSTLSGRHLLTHELVHVVQQSQRPGTHGNAAAAEIEADRIATRMADGHSVSVTIGVPVGIQNKPLSEEELELEIAAIDKVIEESEARVEGVNLPAEEEQHLYEVRSRMLEERADLQAQLDARTSEDLRLQGPAERQRIVGVLKKRLKEPRSYPGRETDQAEFDAIDGPLLSYLEDVQLSEGNRYARRLPGGWYVADIGYIEASEGGTTTSAIDLRTERDRLEAERNRVARVERAGGDVANEIYWQWRNRWSDRLKKAIVREESLRSHLKIKLGSDAFGSAWLRFHDGVEYNDEVWLEALGPEYPDVYFEVEWAKRMVEADPAIVRESVSAFVRYGRRPTEADFEQFVESAYRQKEYAEALGMALGAWRGGRFFRIRPRLRGGKSTPARLRSPAQGRVAPPKGPDVRPPKVSVTGSKPVATKEAGPGRQGVMQRINRWRRLAAFRRVIEGSEPFNVHSPAGGRVEPRQPSAITQRAPRSTPAPTPTPARASVTSRPQSPSARASVNPGTAAAKSKGRSPSKAVLQSERASVSGAKGTRTGKPNRGTRPLMPQQTKQDSPDQPSLARRVKVARSKLETMRSHPDADRYLDALNEVAFLRRRGKEAAAEQLMIQIEQRLRISSFVEGRTGLGRTVAQAERLSGRRVHWTPSKGKPLKLDATSPPADDDIGKRLLRHVEAAIDRFEKESITENQAWSLRALEANGETAKARRLFKTYRGSRIDEFAKESVMQDPALEHVLATQNREPGADFYDSITGKWYDITTFGSWRAHVKKYGRWGVRLPTEPK